jgi:hypothetical protein
MVVLGNTRALTQKICIAYKLQTLSQVTPASQQATFYVHQSFNDSHLKSYIAHMDKVKYSCIALSLVVYFMPTLHL